MATLPNKIQHFRGIKGLSREQLAARVGVGLEEIEAMEAGTCDPKLSLLKTVADVFNVSVPALLEEHTPPGPDERARVVPRKRTRHPSEDDTELPLCSQSNPRQPAVVLAAAGFIASPVSPEKAKDLASGLPKADPRDGGAEFLRALLAYWQGNYERAEKIFKRAYALSTRFRDEAAKFKELAVWLVGLRKEIEQRRGQADFRDKLLIAYEGVCAISGCNATEALEAAHIVPHAAGGSMDVQNGLLLRSDLHTLFDLGLLRIWPVSREELKIVIDSSLHNTPYFKDYNGKLVRPANEEKDGPDIGALKRRFGVCPVFEVPNPYGL